MPTPTTRSVPNSSRIHHLGEKREAYLRASSENGWGQAATSGCGSMSLLRQHDEQLMILPATCGCWRCTLCGPRRCAWLTKQLADLIEAEAVNRFWTLTLVRSIKDPTDADVDAANKHMSESFNRFRTAAKRLYPAFQYIWTKEHTKAKWPHLHLVTNLPLSRKKLSELWFHASGDSFVVDAHPRELLQSGRYLSKYVTEEAISKRRPRYARAFSKSRGVKMDPFRPPSKHPGSWRLSHRAYWATVQLRISAGDIPTRQKTAGTPWCMLTTAARVARQAWDDLASDVAIVPWVSTLAGMRGPPPDA